MFSGDRISISTEVFGILSLIELIFWVHMTCDAGQKLDFRNIFESHIRLSHVPFHGGHGGSDQTTYKDSIKFVSRRKHSLVDSITDFEFEDPGSIPLGAKSFCIVQN